jgi:NADH:ubiquinone oxidoreductase subunit 6 (subunit J)
MEVKPTIKDMFSVYRKPVVIFVGAIMLLVFFVMTVLPNSQKYVTKLIADMVKKQTEMVLVEYSSRTEALQIEINLLKSQKEISDKNIKALKQKMGVIENEIADNKIPVTNEEMRSRFADLGYKPSN